MSAQRRASQERTAKNRPAPRSAGDLKYRARLTVEALEDRLTPSTNSVLLPAFYGSLLNRQPDFPGASTFASVTPGMKTAPVQS